MNNTIDILNHYLQQEGYVVQHQKIKERLLSDPDNNILAITNTLDFFKIKNLVAEVPKDTFYELPKNFIAQISQNGHSNLVLVSKEDQSSVKIHLEKGKNFVLSNVKFMQHWSGLILAIEKNPEKRDLSLKKHFANLIWPLTLMSMMVLLYLTHKNPILTVLLGLSPFGLAVSWLILKEKYQADNYGSSFCYMSKKTNCKRVINSNSSKLFNTFDLADLSFFFFTTISTYLLIFGFNGLLAIGVIMSITVVPYALYQQGVVLKQWCPLCLVVTTVLLFQGLIVLMYSNTFYFKMIDAAYLLAVGLLSVLLLKQAKLFLFSKLHIENLSIENLSFRRNHYLFIPYFQNLPSQNTELNQIIDIQFGSPNPILKVLVVTNPFCEACFEVHDILKEFLKNHSNDIQLKFRFYVNFKNRNDLKTIIAEKLLELYQTDKNLFNQAWNDWFSKTTAKKWLEQWGKPLHKRNSQILESHAIWCESVNIDSTPTIFLNGKKFPQIFKPNDIVYFIEPILEFEKQNNQKLLYNNTYA